MNVSLNIKILGLGALVVVAIGCMMGISQYSSSEITSMMEQSDQANTLLNHQFEDMGLINKYEYNMVNLTLAAMDSIIDKDEGKIDPDRMAEILERDKFLKENLSKVHDMAKSAEEKVMLGQVDQNLDLFTKTIKEDLVKAIEQSAGKIKKIDNEFHEIDDHLDEYGDGFQQKIEDILAEFKVKKQAVSAKANSSESKLLDTGIYQTETILKNHLSLMLTAMDSIIDKDEGRINDARSKEIDKNVREIKASVTGLAKFGDIGINQSQISDLMSDFEKLSAAIQVDLKTLIEKSAVEQKQIEALFVKFDDDLDAAAGVIEKALNGLKLSVENRVTQAEKERAGLAEKIKHDLKRNTTIAWSLSLALLVILCVLFFVFARNITVPIRRIIEGLDSGADQVSSASGQVSSASQSLADGTSRQAASIEETSSSLEEISSMTKVNAQNASQADSLMNETGQVVETAKQSMDALTASMEEIAQASEETQKIIKTIDEIAFQTNLLALNAAVEAARAGEAGAGFAVVADEVRNLAMRAADAAKDTAQLIEGTVGKISKGTEIVHVTSGNFSEVSVSAQKIAGLVTEIAAASNDQSQGIEQINTAIGEVDQVTQQNAANAEESASASEELSAQAHEMKTMVEDLVALIEGKSDKRSGKSSSYRNIKTIAPVAAVEKKAGKMSKKLGKAREIRPEQVIPFDEDEDFQDF